MSKSDAPGERPLPRVIHGAIEYGKSRDWEMIDVGLWGRGVPGFVKPDGLITHLGHRERSLAIRLHQAVPCGVSIDYLEHPGADIPTVISDDKETGIRGAEYMLNRGFRNFAITGYSRRQWSPRMRAFEARVIRDGAECVRIPAFSMRNVDLSIKADFFIKRLIRQKLPLAIFCVNDRLAVRVCRWCREAGFEVPEQVTVLGVGNDALACECSPVPVSSVDLQCERRGAEAARLLQRMIDGEPPPVEPLLVPPGEVVTRRSTDILAIRDPASARALRYIWDHYTENIGSQDVASACDISRRSLDRHFSAALGRSVSQELTRRRLAKARELLLTTEMQAADIAAITGFGSPQYFSRRFSRRFGVSPQVYREQRRAGA